MEPINLMLESDTRILRDRFQRGTYTSDSGTELYFKTNRIYNDEELKSYFLDLDISQESEYFEFLITFGACDIFAHYDYTKESQPVLLQSIEFFPIENLREINVSISNALENDLPRFFIVAHNAFLSQYFGFDLAKTNDTFGVFTIDSYPEEWRDETEAWCTFSEWINLLIKTDGRQAKPR